MRLRTNSFLMLLLLTTSTIPQLSSSDPSSSTDRSEWDKETITALHNNKQAVPKKQNWQLEGYQSDWIGADWIGVKQAKSRYQQLCKEQDQRQAIIYGQHEKRYGERKLVFTACSPCASYPPAYDILSITAYIWSPYIRWERAGYGLRLSKYISLNYELIGSSVSETKTALEMAYKMTVNETSIADAHGPSLKKPVHTRFLPLITALSAMVHVFSPEEYLSHTEHFISTAQDFEACQSANRAERHSIALKNLTEN